MFGNKKKEQKVAQENLRMYELQSKNKKDLTRSEKSELKKLVKKKEERDFDEMAFWVEALSDDFDD